MIRLSEIKLTLAQAEHPDGPLHAAAFAVSPHHSSWQVRPS